MAIIQDLQELAPLAVREGREPESGDDQNVRFLQFGKESRPRAVGAGHQERAEEPGSPEVEARVPIAKRLVGQGTRDVCLARSRRPDHEDACG